MSKPQINTKIIFEARKLFKAKNWSLESSRFESFMHCLSFLNKDEKQLLLSLTAKFKEIGINSYIKELSSAYKKIPQRKKDHAEKIFIYPLTRLFKQNRNKKIVRTRGVPKSGEIIYQLLSNENIDAFQNEMKILFEKDLSLSKIFNHFNFDKDLLILVDDFAGTGDTAHDICKQFLNLALTPNRLKPENIIVLTMVAQRKAVDKLKSINISLYANHISDKGISSSYPDYQSKILMMQEMEKKIGMSQDLRDKYSLGYEKSEALYSFQRPPNNTFPIYWIRTSKIKNPIFPRITKNYL